MADHAPVALRLPVRIAAVSEPQTSIAPTNCALQHATDICRLIAIEVKVGLGRIGVTSPSVAHEHAERDERIQEIAGATFVNVDPLSEGFRIERSVGKHREIPSSTALSSVFDARKAWPISMMRSGVGTPCVMAVIAARSRPPSLPLSKPRFPRRAARQSPAAIRLSARSRVSPGLPSSPALPGLH